MGEVKNEINKLFEIMYESPTGPLAFTVSIVFFFLYMILQLIELNTFVKNMDILDPSKTTRGTFVYVYLVGYYSFIFKIFIQLFTVVVLLTIIVWVIVGVTHIFKTSHNSGGAGRGGGRGVAKYNSASEMRGGTDAEIGNKLYDAFTYVFINVMGIILSRNFFMVFFIMIPILILFFTIIFAQFYDRDMILNNDADKTTRIMLTNHNFMMMIITMLSIIGVITMAAYYYFTFIPK